MPSDAIADMERQIEKCQTKINVLTPFKSSPEVAAVISDCTLQILRCTLALQSPDLLLHERRQGERET